MGKQINVEWDSIRHRCSVEPRQVCFLPSKQLLLTWLPDVQSSTLRWCRGVSIMASMQVRIQLTAISHLRYTWHKVWCFLVFLTNISFRYTYIFEVAMTLAQRRWDLTVTAQGLALDLCLAIQLAHQQQHQVAASTEASFLVMYADEWQSIFSQLLVNFNSRVLVL